MLKQFRIIGLCLVAVFAMGAVAASSALASEDTLNVGSGTLITAAVNANGARFQAKAGGTIINCKKSSGGYTTTSTEVPNKGTLTEPALSYTECNNSATVTVNGSTEMTLESKEDLEVGESDLVDEDIAGGDTATLTVPATSSIVIKLPGCTITISGQAFTGAVGEEPATLTFANTPVPYSATGSLCGLLGVSTPTGTGVFNAIYNVTPSTLDDLS